jgi:hypothetical protein
MISFGIFFRRIAFGDRLFALTLRPVSSQHLSLALPRPFVVVVPCLRISLLEFAPLIVLPYSGEAIVQRLAHFIARRLISVQTSSCRVRKRTIPGATAACRLPVGA